MRADDNGTPDLTFGIYAGRTAPVPASTFVRVSTVAVQPDGKLIVAGSTTASTDYSTATWRPLMMRFTSEGGLDATFGDGGFAHLPGLGTLEAVRRQTDGRWLVIGTERATDVDPPAMRVARLSADGYLDTSFGDAGVARVDFSPFAGGATGDSIAVLGDGRVVVAGRYGTQSGVALARLLSDGSLDTSFGYGGWITTTSTSSHVTLHVAADGKLVVSTGYEVLRYNADGFLDEAFALGGRKTFPVSIVGFVLMSSALQPDGKLVIAGNGYKQEPGVARLLMDGPFTTTTLRSSAIPARRDQAVTLTATVAGANLAGAVRFMDGADPIAGCEAIPLSGATAVCTYTASTAGQHVLRAVYYENM